MADSEEVWKPGSFTKNFSWGHKGLAELHDSIRQGFEDRMADVPREDFRQRVADLGRPDYIPINFFLFNRPRNGVDWLVADELVFQALTARHSTRFDRLGVFAFNLSMVGRWQGAKPYQRRPALWANRYVGDRVAGEMRWNTKDVSADDIQRFVDGSGRYVAKGSRKLSTNLNHFYRVGRLSEFASPKVERWWADAVFLALDRIIADRRLDRRPTPENGYRQLLEDYGFADIAGARSLEKRLAAGHLVRLYVELGGPERFTLERVEARERDREDLPPAPRDTQPDDGEDDETPPAKRRRFAVHPTNLRIVKSIPAMCARLAVCAGFDVLTAVQMREFDPEEFIRRRADEALRRLEEQQVRPTMSVAELVKLTRGE